MKRHWQTFVTLALGMLLVTTITPFAYSQQIGLIVGSIYSEIVDWANANIIWSYLITGLFVFLVLFFLSLRKDVLADLLAENKEFVTIVALIILIVLSSWLWNIIKTPEIESQVIQFLSWSGVTITTVLTAFYSTLDNIQKIKEKNTNSFIRMWDVNHIDRRRHLSVFIDNNKLNQSNPLNNLGIIDSNTDFILKEMAGFYEEIYLQIQYKYIDKETVKKRLKDPYLNFTKIFKIWLESKKQDFPDTIQNIANLANEFS